jgi:UDPglucose 6-dehydrogenase
MPSVDWCESPLKAAEGADAVVVLTEWNEFRALDLKALRAAMSGNVLVDLRNVYSRRSAAEAGFVYRGIGRNAIDRRPDEHRQHLEQRQAGRKRA